MFETKSFPYFIKKHTANLLKKTGITDHEKDTQNERRLIPGRERLSTTIFKVYLGPPICPPYGYCEFYLGWVEGNVEMCE